MLMRCSSCGGENAGAAPNCSSCGVALDRGARPAVESTGDCAPLPPASRRDEPPRFEPGHRLGKRYRIVGLIGRGGMGDVYRADDLELGTSVALKFLSARIASNPSALQRFRNEVRTARQVTHVNVCRIHDIGEEEGHVFLAMEHVDGEDLASLLRRIGRPSREKGVEMARQLCAGLAAAHQAGVLHRDLKPGNVMIDGRGRVRITDFGLAGLAKDLEGAGGIEGTPAYMAPEQIAGRGVTVRSDVYSLGLVLYEIFTGKRALQGRTFSELKREHESGSITSASTHARDLDPAVERVLEGCLEKDPSRRPSSAHAVLRALPGGDPLAEALAAGETPSPDLIAHAGDSGSLAPRVALGLLAGIVAAYFLATAIDRFGERAMLMVPPTSPPSVLEVQADNALRSLGWGDLLAGHEASGLGQSGSSGIVDLMSSPERMSALPDLLATLPPQVPGSAPRRRPNVTFWRRWSPAPLVAIDFHQPTTKQDDPPLTGSGQACIVLDGAARLEHLIVNVQPKEAASTEVSPTVAGAPDWTKLFALAELDAGRYRSIAVPRAKQEGPEADVRASWEGPWPDDPERTLRIHAGARSGRPVFWEIEWTPPPTPPTTAAAPTTPPGGESSANWLRRLMKFWNEPSVAAWRGNAMLLAFLALAWRHVRSGRSDSRGAFRFGAAVTALYWLGGWAIFPAQEASFAAALQRSFSSEHLGHALVHGALMGVYYLALEPYARRLWPRMLVGWTRLLQGRLTDPLVGREVLIGAVVATAAHLLLASSQQLGVAMGVVPPIREMAMNMEDLGSPAAMAWDMLVSPARAILGSMDVILPLLLWSLILRRPRLAWVVVVAMTVLSTTAAAAGYGAPVLAIFGAGVMSVVGLLVLARAGFLSTVVFLWLVQVLGQTLPAFGSGSWARGVQLEFAAIVVGVAALAAWTSMAGRPILGSLLDEKMPGTPADS